MSKDIYKMTATDITRSLFVKYVYNTQSLCVANIYYWSDVFESDFLAVSKAGYGTEFEIKISKKDFLKDFEKKKTKSVFDKEQRMWINAETFKHDMLKEGRSKLKHFYFCVPEGLVSLGDIPDHAGLIEFKYPIHAHQSYLKMNIIKKAPELPGSEKMDSRKELKIREAQKWQYYKQQIRK